MGDVNPPESQTNSAKPAGPLGNFHLKPDIGYFMRIPGILTVVELVLSIIVIICAGNANTQTRGIAYYAGGGFVLFTAIVAMIVGVIRIVAYVLGIPQQTEKFMWVLQGLVYYAVWTLLYFISGAVSIDGAVKYANALSATPIITNSYYEAVRFGYAAGRDGFGASAFFCWLAAIVYGFHALLFFFGYRNNSKQEEIPFSVPARFAGPGVTPQSQPQLSQQTRHQTP